MGVGVLVGLLSEGHSMGKGLAAKEGMEFSGNSDGPIWLEQS